MKEEYLFKFAKSLVVDYVNSHLDKYECGEINSDFVYTMWTSNANGVKKVIMGVATAGNNDIYNLEVNLFEKKYFFEVYSHIKETFGEISEEEEMKFWRKYITCEGVDANGKPVRKSYVF